MRCGADPTDAALLQGVLVHNSYICDRMLIRLYRVHIYIYFFFEREAKALPHLIN